MEEVGKGGREREGRREREREREREGAREKPFVVHVHVCTMYTLTVTTDDPPTLSPSSWFQEMVLFL